MPLTLKNFNKVTPPLCFTANTAGSKVRINTFWTPTSVTLETSTDNVNWSSYTFGTNITLSNIWDKLYFRNTSESDTWFSTSTSDFYQFTISWSIAWSGDVTMLVNKNWTTTISNYCFYRLFYWCGSLTTAPLLNATTLATQCYDSMFYSCTSLTTVPDFPVATLGRYCCNLMFYYCNSLEIAPALPATTLVDWCYQQMFAGCSKLISIPKLPATALQWWCYNSMFSWCSKIKLSTSKTGEYQTEYRIPTTWTWTTVSSALTNMFYSTWGSFTWTPSINTTYYTSNTLV